MSTTIDRDSDTERDAQITRAGLALLRRAEAQGVKPITSLEDLAGDPKMTADFDVDEFLRRVHEDRDRSSAREQ